MPAAKPTPPRYVITGVAVGPFKAGDQVTAEELEAAGLDVDHLVKLGQLDREPAAIPAPPLAPAEE